MPLKASKNFQDLLNEQYPINVLTVVAEHTEKDKITVRVYAGNLEHFPKAMCFDSHIMRVGDEIQIRDIRIDWRVT